MRWVSPQVRSMRQRALTARRLRRDSTEPERRLWRALREANLPHRVRRQHPGGEYIVDFAIPTLKLAIDGGQHDWHREADARRTAAIEGHGYSVIRFWNSDVMDNLDGVLEVIAGQVGQGGATP